MGPVRPRDGSPARGVPPARTPSQVLDQGRRSCPVRVKGCAIRHPRFQPEFDIGHSFRSLGDGQSVRTRLRLAVGSTSDAILAAPGAGAEDVGAAAPADADGCCCGWVAPAVPADPPAPPSSSPTAGEPRRRERPPPPLAPPPPLRPPRPPP